MAEGIPNTVENRQKQTQALGFIAALSVCFLLCAVFGSFHLARQRQVCAIDVDSTINPNTAGVASLMRLPGIGPKRAAAIIECREDHSEGKIEFEEAADLRIVKGIGPKTVKKIKQWLSFE